MSNISAHVGQKMIEQHQQQRSYDLGAALRSKCRAVEADDGIIGVYSTGEVCAVALIMNRMDLLPQGYTALHAVDRIGENWFAMCLSIQRNGWAQP